MEEEEVEGREERIHIGEEHIWRVLILSHTAFYLYDEGIQHEEGYVFTTLHEYPTKIRKAIDYSTVTCMFTLCPYNSPLQAGVDINVEWWGRFQQCCE